MSGVLTRYGEHDDFVLANSRIRHMTGRLTNTVVRRYVYF